MSFAIPDATFRAVRVNGSTGVIVQTEQRVISIMAFTISAGQITQIYALLDPQRIHNAIAGRPISEEIRT
jgi:hypothetical protein